MLPQNIGRYQIKAELGRGGMSTVYLAHDPHFERDVAVKLLPHELLHHRTFRRRFDREAKIVAALDHPAIVPVYDFGEQDEQPFLIMRFMAGGSLTDRLKQGPLNIAEAARILQRLAPALDEVHRRGVVHRDLKPSNILFDQRNEPYISDFGTAKFTYEHTKLTETGGAVGTPAYMSPEQIQAEVEIDGRSDIYTLGVILFEMLTGHHPYQTNTPIGLAVKHIFEPVPRLQDMQPTLPAACQPIIARVMAKKREERYQTAVAFANDLTAVSRQLISSDAPVSPRVTISGRRLALLIGNDDYQDGVLSQLMKPTADVPRLARALQHPEIGRFDEVVCLLNEPTDDVRRAIARFFAEKAPDDLLLLYVVGHAALDASNHLHLTTQDTEHNLLRGTAVSATFIADEMDNCQAARQLLILDCYFSRALASDKQSANALPGIIGKAIDTGASFTRHGRERVILTASDATHYIWHDHSVSGQPMPSRFTEFFIQGLENGAGNGRENSPITISELYDYVTRQLAVASPNRTQLPRKWIGDDQNNIVIALNAQIQPVSANGAGSSLGSPSPRPHVVAPAQHALPGKNGGAQWFLWLAAFVLLGSFLFVGGKVAAGNGRLPFYAANNEPTPTPTTAPLTPTPQPTRIAATSVGPAPTEPAAGKTPTTTPTDATATAVSATQTPTPTTSLTATAITLLPSSLFAAPDTAAQELAVTNVDETVTVLGRSAEGNWLYVLNDNYVAGYIYADRVAWTGDFAALPAISPDAKSPTDGLAGCAASDCTPLTFDLYPVDGRCESDIGYRTVYMQGQGGDGRYTYYWNDSKLAGPLTTGFGFEVSNRISPRIIGTGKVVSGDGQIVEKPLFISEFPCTP